MHAPLPADPSAPVAPRRASVRIHHGDRFEDPYEWLRDKDDPEVIAHLEAENAYTKVQTGHLTELADAVFDEIKARTKETDLTVPSYASHRGGSAYWYYSRTVEGSEYSIYCRVLATDRRTPPDVETEIPGEEVLLDGNAEAAGHDFFSLGAFSFSEDGRLLAYSVDLTGAERFTLMIKDLTTGELLPEQIPDTAYGAAWARNDHLFYTRADQSWRPYVVLRHRLGTDPATDVEVLTEPDERFWLGVDSSRDERWIVIGAGSKLTSEYRLLSTDDPEGEPRLIAPRRQGVEYDVEPAGDRLLIVHNDGAEDFELAEAPLTATDHTEWRAVIAHQPGVRILGVSAYASHVVVSLRRDGLSGVHLIPRDEQGGLGTGADITFDEPLYTVEASGDSEYDTPTIRLGYGSMLTPESVYDYDLATGELILLKRTPVLPDPTFGPYDPDRYVQERGWARAADGTAVPLSIVRRADVPLDGSAPAVLYGYGSYELPMDPSFSIFRLSLLDRGIVYAIAHVRGGGELGRGWYEQGKMLSKINTFTDFVACADYLIEAGYTASDRLAARGGSAGGLLMGAVTNMRPDLFKAVVTYVPFVDVMNTMLDSSLPLTVGEYLEWGNPNEKSAYDYMKSYSPYDNIEAKAYPTMLVRTSLNDSQVMYWEPAKYVSKLRAMKTDNNLLLFKIKLEPGGHGGASGRYDRLKDTAFDYAFILGQFGIVK